MLEHWYYTPTSPTVIGSACSWVVFEVSERIALNFETKPPYPLSKNMEYLLLFILFPVEALLCPEQLNYWWCLQMVVVVSEVLWADLNERGSLISSKNSGSWICFCFKVHICTTQISFYFLQHLYVQHRQGHVSL